MAALRSLRSLAIHLSIVALVILLVKPYESSFGSTRRSVNSRFKTDYNGADNGMCASAVTVHGYKCQEFEVTTDDGYILSVQRIPEGRVGGGDGRNRQPVLLQHGVLVYAEDQWGKQRD
ncbi:hypothetical protein FXO38_24603 [Capsicum annuum]|nr:hypothetical protein FXO38_24603 [Capsicum annuum]